MALRVSLSASRLFRAARAPGGAWRDRRWRVLGRDCATGETDGLGRVVLAGDAGWAGRKLGLASVYSLDEPRWHACCGDRRPPRIMARHQNVPGVSRLGLA